jgi:hypothetical protein
VGVLPDEPECARVGVCKGRSVRVGVCKGRCGV